MARLHDTNNTHQLEWTEMETPNQNDPCQGGAGKTPFLELRSWHIYITPVLHLSNLYYKSRSASSTGLPVILDSDCVNTLKVPLEHQSKIRHVEM